MPHVQSPTRKRFAQASRLRVLSYLSFHGPITFGHQSLPANIVPQSHLSVFSIALTTSIAIASASGGGTELPICRCRLLFHLCMFTRVAQNRRGDRRACMKKSACLIHALTRGPTKGPFRMHEETMRPAGRIITYMPFGIEMFGRISCERRVALMLH